VQFFQAVDQTKAPSEFPMQRVRIVTLDVQPTAFLRSFRPKRTNDDVPAWFDRLSGSVHVGNASGGGGQKMKHGAIVPDVISIRGKVRARHIRDHPFNTVGECAEAGLCYIDCGLRDIEDRQMRIAAR
jgi:hypothetical protein